MDSVAHGNSQGRGILHPVKQNLKENGSIITIVVSVLICIGGAVAITTAIVVKAQKTDHRHSGRALNREDVAIVIGACLMVLAMYLWYRLAGNVSILELYQREITRYPHMPVTDV